MLGPVNNIARQVTNGDTLQKCLSFPPTHFYCGWQTRRPFHNLAILERTPRLEAAHHRRHVDFDVIAERQQHA